MFLKHFRVSRFKGFDTLTINNLSPELNFIYGINGSGKTRLFDAIKFVQDCLTHDLKHAILIRGGVEEVFGNNEFIRFDFGFQTMNALNIQYQLEIGFDTSNGVFIKEEAVNWQVGDKTYHSVLYHSFNSIEFITNQNDVWCFGYEPMYSTAQYAHNDIALKFKIDDEFDVTSNLRKWVHDMFFIEPSATLKLYDEKSLIELRSRVKDIFDFEIQTQNPNRLSKGQLSLLNSIAIQSIEGKSILSVDSPEQHIHDDFLLLLAYEYLNYSKLNKTQVILFTGSKSMLDAVDISNSYLIENESSSWSTITKLANMVQISEKYNSGIAISKINF